MSVKHLGTQWEQTRSSLIYLVQGVCEENSGEETVGKRPGENLVSSAILTAEEEQRDKTKTGEGHNR